MFGLCNIRRREIHSKSSNFRQRFSTGKHSFFTSVAMQQATNGEFVEQVHGILQGDAVRLVGYRRPFASFCIADMRESRIVLPAGDASSFPSSQLRFMRASGKTKLGSKERLPIQSFVLLLPPATALGYCRCDSCVCFLQRSCSLAVQVL